jgi:hypothetical protein
MVPGYHEDGNPRVGEAGESLIGAVNDASIDPAAEEEIAAVEEEVRPGALRVVENPLEVLEEVLSPAPNVYPRAQWVVETQMRVSEKDDAELLSWGSRRGSHSPPWER